MGHIPEGSKIVGLGGQRSQQDLSTYFIKFLPFLQGLRQHLLHYKLPDSALPEGFELYPQLPPLRQQYLQRLTSGMLQNGVSEA